MNYFLNLKVNLVLIIAYPHLNDEKLSFKFPVSMKKKLVAMSKERDIPISSIIRSLIREELKKYELGKN